MAALPASLDGSGSASGVLHEATASNGARVMVAAEGPLCVARPGNGGLRIFPYETPAAGQTEAFGLAFGMARKHAAHGTGFAGAKVVVDVGADNAHGLPEMKPEILRATSRLLNELEGSMYTGCDINSSLQDMDTLLTKHNCPYILASMGQPADPSVATAAGVVGALDAAMGGFAGKTVLVHGAGKVGTAAALLLAEGGAKVLALDVVPGLVQSTLAAAGVVDVGDVEVHGDWWTIPGVDAVAPCSGPYIFTEKVVEEMQQPLIVGATNLPFASMAAYLCALERGIQFVPEGISSAGAVIEDSVEFFANEEFVQADPTELYDFARQSCFERTRQLMGQVKATGSLDTVAMMDDAVAAYNDSNYDEVPLGSKFPAFAEKLRSQFYAVPGPTTSSVVASNTNSTVKQTARAFCTSAAHSSLSSPRGNPSRFSASAGRRALSTDSGSQTADVVIVGGGIMGLSTAYQLKRRNPAMKVTILEKGSQLGAGSSGWSTGFMRAYYSFDETMGLALDGINAYKNWSDYLQDSEAEAYFTETGSLWMLGYNEADNQKMVDRLGNFGVQADCLDANGILEMYPQLNTDAYPKFDDNHEQVDQDLGPVSAVFEHGCGHLDSNLCLSDMLRVCQREGVDVRFSTRVSSLLVDGGRISGVALADGEEVSAGYVVNAAGPWFNQLNATAGVDLGISTTALATRIQVGTFRNVPEEFLSLPFVADGWGESGIYFMPRVASGELVFGSVAHRFESEIVDDPDALNTALDPDVREDYLSCLFWRLPNFPTDGSCSLSGFSSMYTVNQDDVHPMIGETKLPGLWACNGFSGHGFKLAPAIGSLVAQQITGDTTAEWDTSCPLDFLAADRESLTMKVKTHFA